ncbi:MAG: lipid-A-disaccharide synthase [Candidatus Cloacimonadaceae bacterium]|nr:lipid-A-disaccharide synthase [Candidatus Cloacimonadaceae bacterium]
MNKAYSIFWLVGESSGDLHAELVMKSINESIPNVRHVGIGGPRMQQMGLIPLYPFSRFAVMGFVEVIKHLLFFMGVERRIKKLFKRDKPDLAILVDYPGLNLRIADLADNHRIPVLYFICPQFWAWKHERVYKLKASVRHTACILPFEKELLDIHNVTSTYVGHPIAEEVKFDLDRQSFATFFSLDASKRWIGFFPGSRNDEIKRMLPVFLETAKRFDGQDYQILFSKSRSVNHTRYMETIEQAGAKGIHLIDGYAYEMMKYCDLLICTSGTVTLEAAFIGTPSIIAYKASPVSYRIGRYFIRIKRIGLPNIVLDADVLPEMIQDDVTPAKLSYQAAALLDDPERMIEIKAELLRLKAMLSDRKASVEMLKLVRNLLRIDA